MCAVQMGFGDVQVPGPLPPPVNESSQVGSETDLTYIAPPSGTQYPLYICHDRASRPHRLLNLMSFRSPTLRSLPSLDPSPPTHRSLHTRHTLSSAAA